MNSEDDNGRSDEYWMGVRDALRMVDSFNKWSKRNPGRAKDLEDFIHDGLIAAAKRCESCLRDKMGISFTSDEADDEVAREEFREEDDDDDYNEDKVVLEEIPVVEDEPVIPEPSFEEPVGHVEPEPFAPSSEGSDDISITLDSVEHRDDEEMEDLSIEGPPREFTTDFELVEPIPLVVDEEGSVSEPEPEPKPELAPEPEPEEVVSGPPEEVVSGPPEEDEKLPDKPAFTWSEYEEAVSPSSEPEPLDPEVDIVPSEDETVSIDEPEEVSEEPPEPPTVWSTHDESSAVQDDEMDEADVVESEPEETEEEPVISEPPAPPPPPESEEDEEERKRRARRLFFGA
ncbi:MAG: hypothetical protein ACTSSE_03255 [Candidatus Thorarchaeota archaeon]